MKKILALLFAASAGYQASASLNISAASGGTGILADTAANAPTPAWTTLGNIQLREVGNTHKGDFGAGTDTFALNAPAGFEFNTAAGSVSFASAKDITSATLTVSSTTLSLSVSVGGVANLDTLTITGVQVRPTSASPLAANGNITLGTSANLTFGNNPTFGALSEVAGIPAALAIQTQPSTNATAATAFAQQPVIWVVDQFGNRSLTNSSAVVSASVNSGVGTLAGTTDIKAAAGVVTYTNLAANASSAITILFASSNLTSAVSTSIDVSGPPVASALVIQTQPSANATAGVAFAQQPVIVINDQFGAAFTNDNSTVVTAARFDGAGVLQGTTTATAVNGVVTFTDLSHTVATNITIRFTAGLLSSATSQTITVAPATASQLAFTTQPANVFANVPFSATVSALDAFGNVSSVGLGSSLNVGLTLTSGVGPLAGTTTADIGTAAGNGIATFSSLTVGSVDSTNQLTASASGFTDVTSAIFTSSAQVPAQLVIATQPSSNAVAGVAFAQQPVVEIRDAGGNLVSTDNSTVVHVARGTGTSALVGTVDATAVNGVATFSGLSYNTAQTITLVFTSAGLTNATSASVVVSPAPADHLVFTTQPAGGYADSAFVTQPALLTRDAFGNNSTVGLASNQVISVALTSGTGSLIGTTTVDIGLAAGNGVATFTDLGVSAAGNGKAITASSAGFTNAVSATFTIGGVDPAVANISADTAVSGFTTITGPTYYEAASGDVGLGTIVLNAPAGYEFDTGGTAPTVRIQKLSGGSNTGNIQGTGSPSGGANNAVWPVSSVSATQIGFTITATSAPGKTDSLTWQNIRMRALVGNPLSSGVVTNSGTAALVGTTPSTSFANVQTVGGAPAQIVIATQPSTNAAVGVAFAQQPVIQLFDQFGNLCNGNNTAVVTAARNLGMSDLQGTTNITVVGGVATFTNLSYNVAEAITINFGTGALTPVTSDTILVGAGTIDHLAFTTQPAGAIAGVPFLTQPVIKTVDIYGNPTTGGLAPNQMVVVSLASGTGPLAGTTMFDIGTAAGNGTVTYTDLQINSADANNQLQATAVESGMGSALSSVFVVTPAPSSIVAIQGDGQNVAAGSTVTLNPTVQVLDSNTNPIVSATVVFNVTLGGGSVGTASATTDGSGYASTTWTLGTTAGANTLVASTPGLLSNVTFNATATSGAAAQLVITTQPSTNAVAGVVFAQQPVVQLQDAFGNVVVGDSSTVVTATRGTGTAALQGTVNVSAVNGVVTFTDLAYNTAETITLVFSAQGVTNATSALIVVSPATADRLAFSTQPAGAYAGAAFTTQPVVVTRDQFGNNSTVGLSSNQVVTLALTTGSGTLIGTTSLDLGSAAGNGIATFSDVGITAAGNGKVITASSAGLTNATTTAFNVGGVDPAIANVSADTAISGSTTITGPTYYEAKSGDVGVGSIVLNAPAGYQFDTAAPAPTVRIQKSSGPGNTGNIQGTGSPISGGANNHVWPVSSVTATQITFDVASSSVGVTDTLTWQNIRLRALTGSPLGSGIVTDSGTATLAAVVNGVTSFANVQTVAGALNHLVISTQPSTNALGGVPFAQQPVIALQDQFHNVLVNDSTTQVTATRNVGTASLLGTTTVTATNGYVTFSDLAYSVAEMITIDFSTGVLPVVTSDPIYVGAGIADHLVFTVEPNGAVVGYPFGIQPVVRAVDAYGNFTAVGLPTNLLVTVTLTTGTGPLAGTTSVDIGTAAGNGTATFTDLQINAADLNNQLTASASGLGNGVSAVFTVTTADHILYGSGDGQVGLVSSPLAAPFVVQAVDTNNAPVAGVYVTFTVNNGGGTLSAASVLTDTNGFAATTLTLGPTVGTSNNIVTATAFVPGNPKTYTFYASADPGVAAQLGIQTQPSTNAVAGVAFAPQPVIRIEDANGNLIGSDNTTVVTVARGTGTAALQGTVAATAVGGVVTFTNLSYNKAETINLLFTASGLTGTNSVDITVTPAAASQLAFTTQPGKVRTDSILNPQPVVKSEDQFGNASTVGLSTSLIVSVALTNGTGTLLGTTTLDIGTAAGNGVATFTNLQITAAGLNKQLVASAAGLSNALSATFLIGGVDPAVIPTVPADGSSVSATGPAYYELASGDVGAGTIVLTAPTGYQFDTTSTPTVTVKRIGGNGAPGNNINGASNGGNGTTYPVTTFTPSQIVFTVTSASTNGVTDSVTWNNIKIKAAVGIPAAQTPILKTGTSVMAAVTDNVTSFGNITSVPRPVQLVVQTQPSSTANAGVAFAQQPVVLVEDQFGNVWTNTSVNVTASSTGTAALQGTTTVGSVDGVVAFAGLSYNAVETIAINFTASGLVDATSTTVTVGPGIVSRLAFSTQPGGAVFGSALNPQPVVKTQDQFGNNSTVGLGTNVAVTLTLTSGTGSLVGTTTVDIGTAAGNGTVAFSGLSVDAAGVKQITASASGLTSAVSSSFTIDKANQTITFGPLSDKVTNDAPFSVSATASSSLNVTFSIVSGPATILGNTITLDGTTGVVVVRASQSGDANYNAAPDVDQSFNVLASSFPVITTQPQDQTVNQGSDATFTVGATGPSIAYQWLFGGNPIAGANSNTLVITNAQSANEGVYSVIVSNSTAVLISSNAMLTVIVPPSITSQPTSATAGIGDNFSLPVSPSAGFVVNGTQPFTYQWQKDGSNLSTQTNSALSLLNAQVADAGNYTVIIGNAAGSVTSAPIAITVVSVVAPSITTQPADQSATVATSATFSVGANGTTLSYQWRFNGTNIANATGTSYTVNNVRPWDAGAYSVVVSNSAGVVVSSNAILTVVTIPNDIDFDGHADLLLQSTNNFLALWNLDGTNFFNSFLLNDGVALARGWKLVGQGDFNHDGQTDFLFQNGGFLRIWEMDGTNVIDSVAVNTNALASVWKVAGTCDLNHDGNVDIVFRHVDGYVSVMLMNGTKRTSSVLLRNGLAVPTTWRIGGFDDFDHDGNVDILWQADDGRLNVWYMNGVKFKQGASLGKGLLPSQGWRIAGLVDLNADGTRDILWRGKNGQLVVWFLNGTNVIGSNVLLDGEPLPAGWSIVGER